MLSHGAVRSRQLALLSLYALLELARAQDVAVVTSADEFFAAVEARRPFIKITEHLQLTDNSASERGYFKIDDDQSYAVWGECSTPADAAIYDTWGVPEAFRPPTACAIGIGANDPAFHKTGGRLWVSNLLIHSANKSERLDTTTLVEQGAMWNVDVAIAGPNPDGDIPPVSILASSFYAVGLAITGVGVLMELNSTRLTFSVGSMIELSTWNEYTDIADAYDTPPPLQNLHVSGSYFSAASITAHRGPISIWVTDTSVPGAVTAVISDVQVIGPHWEMTPTQIEKSRMRDVETRAMLPPRCGNDTLVCVQNMDLRERDVYTPPVATYTANPADDVRSVFYASSSARQLSEVTWEAVKYPDADWEWLQQLSQANVYGVEKALNPFNVSIPPPSPAPPPAPGADRPSQDQSVGVPTTASNSPSTNTKAIIGGVIGAAATVSILVGLLLLQKSRKRRLLPPSKTRSSRDPPLSTTFTDDTSSTYIFFPSNVIAGDGVSEERTSRADMEAHLATSRGISHANPKSIYHAASQSDTKSKTMTHTVTQNMWLLPPSNLASFVPLDQSVASRPTQSASTSSSGLTFGSTSETLVAEARCVQEASTAADAIAFVKSTMESIQNEGNRIVLGNYELEAMDGQHSGGQGLVYFAHRRGRPKSAFAIKFFVSERAFRNEKDLYGRPDLKHILPPVKEISSNSDGKWKDPRGRVLAPFLILERGEALDSWVRRSAPDRVTSMQMMCHVLKAVIDLHATGLVHRDLKPANTLWLPSLNRWTIIDLGSAAEHGSHAHMSMTLAYAAPETVHAFESKQLTVRVDRAVDVWSLGIQAFELFTNTRVFGRETDQAKVLDAISGRSELPWERKGDDVESCLAKLGSMRSGVLAMLRRDPGERITLPEVYEQWTSLFMRGAPRE